MSVKKKGWTEEEQMNKWDALERELGAMKKKNKKLGKTHKKNW